MNYDKAHIRSEYEAVKCTVDLTIRQRELLEAWLYAGQTMGQLALRYGINRSVEKIEQFFKPEFSL